MYRPILQAAWRTTWRHKRLWFFAVLAGLASAGSVVDIVFRTFNQSAAREGARPLLEGSMIGVTTLFSYIQKLTLVSPIRLQFTMTIVIGGLIALALLIAAGQISLIQGFRGKGKKTAAFLRHTHRLMGRVLAVDVLARLTMIALSLTVAAAFMALRTETVAGDALVNLAVFLVFIPLALIISYFSVFTVIEVVQRHQSIWSAFKATWQVLKKHWLPITELGVILFLVNLVVSLATVIALVLGSVPYLLALRGATLVGSGILWTATITIGTLFFFALICLFFAFMTTFTYATWFEAYEKFGRRSSITSKIERVIQRLTR